MHARTILLATIATAAPLAAFAQPVTGFYVGAGAGANFEQDQKVTTSYTYNALPAQGRFFPAQPAGSGKFTNKVISDDGGVGLVSAGYGFGNGVRVEVEGDYRYNAQHYKGGPSYGSTAREQKYGGFVNAMFDLDIGSPYVFPYLGAGIGAQYVDRLYDTHSNIVLAYQGIAGLAFPIPGLPGLSATFEYRFMGLANSSYTQSYPGSTFVAAERDTNKLLGDYNHSLLLGVRYAFNVAPPPVEAPPPAAVPQATVARSYLVFFDWDRADLTDRARQIVGQAAQASTQVQTTRIDVQGNADRTGTEPYNMALSRRRADVVKAELVRDGVPAAAISVQAFGDTKPLVPTGPGVREPQNRRVAIILH